MTAIDPKILKIIEDTVKERVSEEIKTVQISLLRENFLTRDEFLQSMEKMDKRFEAMDKRSEAMDKRFEAMDKRFEAMQKQIDKRFEAVYRRFDQLDFGHTDIVEGIAYIIVKRELEQRGYDVKLKKSHHFTDTENIVHPDTQDVEIDIFHINPNMIGEATLKLTDIEKVRTFIRKIQLIEKTYKVPFTRFFFCYTIYDNLKEEAKLLFKKYDIELIIPETTV